MVNVEPVTQHYERNNLVERLRAALEAEGLSGKALSAEDLAPLDQFHSRGLAATVELARLLELDRTSQMLDIGSGLGGPSRYLVTHSNCQVQGIDLSQSFVEAARFLAQAAGLSNKVTYRQADALALPFPDEAFDAAWTQHVAMNIADRATFYREAFRVLRPGGRLGIFDVVEASDAPLHFPVPWASTPEASFLITANRMRQLLTDQRFQIGTWIDCTKEGIAWFDQFELAQAQSRSSHAFGLHIVMGPEFPVMTRNLARNLREGRAALIMAVVEK